MARTQAVDYEERREAILDRAAELFAESGFLGTSVSDIAKACDASKSLLYYYYRSKDEVLFGLMNSHVDLLRSDVAEVEQIEGSPQEKLRFLLVRFMEHYLGAAARQKVLLNDIGHLPPSRREEIIGKQREIVAGVQRLLVAIDPAMQEKPGEATARTMLLFGMINWTKNWYDPSRSVSPQQLITIVMEMATGNSSPAK